MSSLEELFCDIDDFCQSFEPLWQQQLLGNSLATRNRYMEWALPASA